MSIRLSDQIHPQTEKHVRFQQVHNVTYSCGYCRYDAQSIYYIKIRSNIPPPPGYAKRKRRGRGGEGERGTVHIYIYDMRRDNGEDDNDDDDDDDSIEKRTKNTQ